MSRTGKADVAARIVKRIEADLNDRRGFHLDTLDADTRKSILDTWRRIVREELNT